MSKFTIPFINLCIMEFGKRFHLTLQASYEYLRTHNGLPFLIEFYDVEHLQSMDETIDDLVLLCKKNGGALG